MLWAFLLIVSTPEFPDSATSPKVQAMLDCYESHSRKWASGRDPANVVADAIAAQCNSFHNALLKHLYKQIDERPDFDERQKQLLRSDTDLFTDSLVSGAKARALAKIVSIRNTP